MQMFFCEFLESFQSSFITEHVYHRIYVVTSEAFQKSGGLDKYQTEIDNKQILNLQEFSWNLLRCSVSFFCLSFRYGLSHSVFR